MPTDRLDEEPAGEMMLYSSGTTGRPKGIKRPLSGNTIDEGMMIAALLGGVFGMDADTVYLSPAPLYHSAPIGFNLGVQSLGGTTVIMEKYDPVEALRLIESHRASHSQWVPTMFVRMLKLDGGPRQVEEHVELGLTPLGKVADARDAERSGDPFDVLSGDGDVRRLDDQEPERLVVGHQRSEPARGQAEVGAEGQRYVPCGCVDHSERGAVSEDVGEVAQRAHR